MPGATRAVGRARGGPTGRGRACRPGCAGTRWSVDGHRVRYGVVGHRPAGPVPPRLGAAAQRLPPAHRGHGVGRLPGLRPRACPGSAAPASWTPSERTFAGYAAWVGHFLDAVGVDEVALVAGHSFGGGVATAFVYDQPGRVSALLLANAIGSPTWALFPNEVRTMVQRPVWDWGRHFGTDLLHSPQLVRLLPDPARGLHPQPPAQPAGDVPHRRVHPPGRPGARGAGHRRAGHPGDGGLVRPRPPGAPVGLRRAAARRRRRRGGGRGGPRLADRRPARPSASWPSAPWSTRARSPPIGVRRHRSTSGRPGLTAGGRAGGGSLRR